MAFKPVDILIRAKDEASGIFSSMGSKVAAVGAAIAGYFGISAFVGAVKGAADLEAKLSEVKAVSNATTAEMVLLRKAAEDAGATTKYTATEAADALGNLARAGLSATDAVTALPAVLQLAAAGGIGLAEASEYITKATMGMGLAFTDAGRVADVLAMGANASNTSVTGLAQALSYAAPLANSLGLSLETTVAIIGKFADAGIDASRAGTALNAILAQFSDPASKFRQELAAAGITTNNFEQALRQMAAAGPAGNKAIAAVGTEAGPALRALLNQGIGALDDLKGKLDGAAGSAAKTAAVMEDNLNGSLNSLSSAWDTVKNALTTPVLPVLRDGVNQLSEALSQAVSNGTIGKFGDAIATAFQNGLKWAREFLGTVDFAALTLRMQTFAADSRETFIKIGEYATNAGNIVKLVYGVMAAGVDAVLVGIYGLGAAFAAVAGTIQNGLALLYEGISKITFGAISEQYKKVAAELRESAAATNAAASALADRTVKSFEAMGDAAQTARDGWSGLTDSATEATTQASAGAKAFESVAIALKEVGTEAEASGLKAKAAGATQKQAADDSARAIADLRAQYQAAVATGNWQAATEAMRELTKATAEAKAGTADLRKKAAEDAQAIADSFSRMGIKTKAELKTAADVAKQDFDRIKASGQATAAGLTEAFKVVAEAAIAANGGVATEAIKSQAAMNGLTITTDATGKTIVKAMGDAAAATGKVGSAAGAAASEYDKLKDAADRATLAIMNQRYERPGGSAKPPKPGDSSGNYDPGYGSPYSKPGDDPRNGDGQTKAEYDRAQSLKGQNAVDNTLLFTIRDKLAAGSLGQADADSVRALTGQLAQNIALSQSFGGVLGTEGLREMQRQQAELALLNNFLTGLRNTSSGQQSSSTAATNVNVRITLPNGTTQTVPTTQEGSQALIAALQSAKLSAGG